SVSPSGCGVMGTGKSLCQHLRSRRERGMKMAPSKLPHRSKTAAAKRTSSSREPIASKPKKDDKFLTAQDTLQECERQRILALTETPGALAAALADVSKTFDAIGSEFRKSRNEILARAYEIAFALRENSDGWRDI